MRRRNGVFLAVLGASILSAGLERVADSYHFPLQAAAGESDTLAEKGEREEPWETPIPGRAYREREGDRLFQHYCAICHGETGGGDGFNAYNLDPKPRDLSDTAFQGSRTDEEIAEVIRLGGGAAGLSGNMPPWGRTLTERKIGYLITRIRAMKPGEAQSR